MYVGHQRLLGLMYNVSRVPHGEPHRRRPESTFLGVFDMIKLDVPAAVRADWEIRWESEI